MRTFIAAAVLAVAMSAQAEAATTAERIAIMKYYACLSNWFVFDKSTCHL